MNKDVRFNLFNSIREPKVLRDVSFSCVIKTIINGGNQKKIIENARAALLKDDKYLYDKLKAELNTISWSCLFNGYRNTKNIISSTGFISIDVDGTTFYNPNDYIHVTYITTSARGRAFVIKTQGITPTNFKYNYRLLSEELQVKSDIKAANPTQPFILSYDPNVFINKTSKVWVAQESKKVHPITEKKRRRIGNGLDLLKNKRRFSNIPAFINEINFNGDAIFDIGEKKGFASIIIPRKGIKKGGRNNIIYAIGCQFRSLNPSVDFNDVCNLLKHINQKHSQPPLAQKELNKIIRSVMNVEHSDLKLNLNEQRRFLFNPDYNLTTSEKRSLVITYLNKSRNKSSLVENSISQWNFIEEGIITQKKLCRYTGLSLSTIKNYYPKFKTQIQKLNMEFSKGKIEPP